MEQDTSPAQMRRYHELLRRLSPGDRLRKACALSQTVRDLALAGLRQRHPQASASELQSRLAVRLFGKDGARRLKLEPPDDAV